MTKKAVVKIVAVLLAVALVVGLALMIFVRSNSGNNQTLSNTTLSITDSENNKTLNDSIVNTYGKTASNQNVTEYHQTLMATNPNLYNKYKLEHLQFMIQYSLLTTLSNDSAFCSKDSGFNKIEDLLKLYVSKQESTVKALNFFNQDYGISTTSATTKQSEFEKIVSCLNEQNVVLIEANKELLKQVKDLTYTTLNAKYDLRIVMFDMLVKQSATLQKQINLLYKDVSSDNYDVIYYDSNAIFRAFLFINGKNFVYSNIKPFINITCEMFTVFYNETPVVESWLDAANKTNYFNTMPDGSAKIAISEITTFINQLAQEAL